MPSEENIFSIWGLSEPVARCAGWMLIPRCRHGVLAGLGPGEAVGLGAGLDDGGADGGAEGEPVDDGIGFLQRGQLEPGCSLVEQAADPHGLLNPGKKA